MRLQVEAWSGEGGSELYPGSQWCDRHVSQTSRTALNPKITHVLKADFKKFQILKQFRSDELERSNEKKVNMKSKPWMKSREMGMLSVVPLRCVSLGCSLKFCEYVGRYLGHLLRRGDYVQNNRAI